jgi:hypothetical protein
LQTYLRIPQWVVSPDGKDLIPEQLNNIDSADNVEPVIGDDMEQKKVQEGDIDIQFEAYDETDRKHLKQNFETARGDEENQIADARDSNENQEGVIGDARDSNGQGSGGLIQRESDSD